MREACVRWERLFDQSSLGEELAPADRSFLQEHLESCAECGAVQNVFDDLASMIDAPTSARSAPARRRPGVWFATAASLAAIAAACFLMFENKGVQPPPRKTPLYHAWASEGVEVDGQRVAPNSEVEAGAVVMARDERACLRIEPAVRACAEPGSLFRIVELGAPRRRVELLRGRLAVELEAQPKDTSFGVVTRDGSAVAIGTAFSVEVLDRGQITTRVLHGVVRVESKNGAQVRLGAHRAVVFGAEPEALLADEEERDLQTLGHERIPERGRVLSAEAAKAPSGSSITAPASRPVQGAVNAPVRMPEASRSAAEWLATARERRARGARKGALSAYRSLFRLFDDSPEAHGALVSYGELLLADGQAQHALHSFERYLAKAGTLSEEAAFGRARALRALGRLEDERAAIARFENDFPNSPLRDGLSVRARAMAIPP